MTLNFNNQQEKINKIQVEVSILLNEINARKPILDKLSLEKYKSYIEKDLLMSYSYDLYLKLQEVFRDV